MHSKRVQTNASSLGQLTAQSWSTRKVIGSRRIASGETYIDDSAKDQGEDGKRSTCHTTSQSCDASNCSSSWVLKVKNSQLWSIWLAQACAADAKPDDTYN